MASSTSRRLCPTFRTTSSLMLLSILAPSDASKRTAIPSTSVLRLCWPQGDFGADNGSVPSPPLRSRSRRSTLLLRVLGVVGDETDADAELAPFPDMMCLLLMSPSRQLGHRAVLPAPPPPRQG